MISQNGRSVVTLPPPAHDGTVSLEAAIYRRRSVRAYTRDALKLSEVSQLLWAAQGITHPEGHRTAASAGGIHPLELYLLAGRVDTLESGLYQYSAAKHQLTAMGQSDKWTQLWSTVLAQSNIEESAVVLAITAGFGRILKKYGVGTERYVHMEVGHVVQNVYLQAAAIDLATVVVGSFADSELSAVLACPDSEHPMVLMPIGRAQ